MHTKTSQITTGSKHVSVRTLTAAGNSDVKIFHRQWRA